MKFVQFIYLYLGPPLINLTNNNNPAADQTSFTLLIQLTIDNIHSFKMDTYIKEISSLSKVKVHFLQKTLETFGYPTWFSRINVSTEVQDSFATKTFQYLIDQVTQSILKIVPQGKIHYSTTVPWILQIDLYALITVSIVKDPP